MKKVKNMSNEKFEPMTEEQQNQDMKVGPAFAEKNRLWDDWYRAMKSGDSQKFTDISRRMDSLEAQANDEWVHAVLLKFGYADGVKEVLVQPFKVETDTGSHNRPAGVTRVSEGKPMSVKIDDITFTGREFNPFKLSQINLRVRGQDVGKDHGFWLQENK